MRNLIAQAAGLAAHCIRKRHVAHSPYFPLAAVRLGHVWTAPRDTQPSSLIGGQPNSLGGIVEFCQKPPIVRDPRTVRFKSRTREVEFCDLYGANHAP
jgi:hypothetical protein